MDIHSYRSRQFGTIEQDHLGPWPHGYFMPEVMPAVVELSQRTQEAVSDAQFGLGKLAGLATLLKDPELLLAPALLREALYSSRIEGTQASLSDVIGASSQEVVNDDIQEVWNYLHALKQGVELLNELPITSRYICYLHETLMNGVRGEGKLPGEIRSTPVWIGVPGGLPAEARYIPPLPSRLGELLGDWEKFVNSPPEMSVVIRCALMHYQFETIHPFLDGNGRIGRLLIGLMLAQEGVLPQPLLYISGYIEVHRNEYYERLQAVRERGEIDEWILFFAKGITEQSEESANRISRLVALQEKYRLQVRGDRSSIPELIGVLFKTPIVTVKLVQSELNVSQPTASTLLRKAEKLGWVMSIGRAGRGAGEKWYAREIWRAHSDENEPTA
jgi:Fic family protein